MQQNKNPTPQRWGFCVQFSVSNGLGGQCTPAFSCREPKPCASTLPIVASATTSYDLAVFLSSQALLETAITRRSQSCFRSPALRRAKRTKISQGRSLRKIGGIYRQPSSLGHAIASENAQPAGPNTSIQWTTVHH